MTQIQPSSYTVDQVLRTYEQIKIPLNQRGFEWGREQASDFWGDIIDSIQDDKKIFLGTLVLKTKDGTNVCEVVDGQQRLTTISLILIALREKEKQLKLKDAALQLNNAYLSSASIMADEYKAKMKTSPLIADMYNQMVDLNWDGIFPAKIGNKQIKRQVKKIKPIYDYFQNSIDNYKFNNKDKIQTLLDTIRNQCYFVVIKIQDDLQALEIFERMNARGIELNAAELLKNHLFVKQLPEEEIAADWDQIFLNSNNDIVKLLRYFYISIRGHVTKDNLYRETKDLIKDIEPKQFLTRLRLFSDSYWMFLHANRKDLEEYLKESLGSIKEYVLDQICDSFEALRLFKVSQHIPLTIAFFNKLQTQKDEKTILGFSRLLVSLENFHFINNAICKKANNEIEKFYAEKCKEIELVDKIEIKQIEKIISGLAERKEKFDTFADNFSEVSYDQGDYYFKMIYYIFDRFNNYGSKGGDRINIFNTDVRVSKKNYNIDHLNPRNPKDHLYDIAIDEDREYINNLGNLLVVSLHANSKAGNDSLIEKVEKVYKKHLKLSTVRDFVESFNKEEWITKDNIFKSIDKRRNELIISAYQKVWVL